MTSKDGTPRRKKRLGLFRKNKLEKKTDEQDNATPPSVVYSPDKKSSNRRVRYQQPMDDNGTAVKQVKDSVTATSSPTKTTSAAKSSSSSSWLGRTKFFQQLVDWAFGVVDADESGEVDEKELYSGLLLIHLKLGCYAGPAACRPVDRQRVHDIFVKMDVDHSGSLDKDEFTEVMKVLCSNVLTRVIVQWSMTLIIVPLIAQYILDAVYYVNHCFWGVVTDLDEYSPMMDRFEVFLETLRDKALNMVPKAIMKVANKFSTILEKVPESVWNTIPLTLLSCILGCLAVPYIIFKIDEHFQGVAEKKKAHLRTTKEAK